MNNQPAPHVSACSSHQLRAPLAFDIGARNGSKTQHLLDAGYQVLAVDLDTSELLPYYGQDPRVEILEAGVSSEIGSRALWVSHQDPRFRTLDPLLIQSGRFRNAGYTFYQAGSVPVTTLERLCQLYGTPHYLKVDVEGHEYSVFCGLQRRIPYIRFEFHEEHFGEALHCLNRLKEFGRLQIAFSYNEQLNPCSLWFDSDHHNLESLWARRAPPAGDISWGDIHVMTFPRF